MTVVAVVLSSVTKTKPATRLCFTVNGVRKATRTAVGQVQERRFPSGE